MQRCRDDDCLHRSENVTDDGDICKRGTRIVGRNEGDMRGRVK